MQVTSIQYGWARFAAPGAEGAARFAETPTGRLAVVELVTVASGRASVPPVRVARVEAWANGLGRDATLAALARRASTDPDAVRAADATRRSEPALRAEWGTTREAEAGQEAALALADPERRDDGFYADVARAYAEATLRSARPAQAIADASGVDVRVVYDWVRAARRRGLIPAARRGAA